MQRKTLFHAFMLCLVMLVSAACSPAAGPDSNRPFGTLGQKKNNLYHNPPGFYDDDKGFKNDFVPSDLNPNMVTGVNDLYNLNGDARIMAQIAAGIPGIDRAWVNINGGTAHVNIRIRNGVDVDSVRAAVYEQVKLKMPRYQIDVDLK
ncbi:hypothetical protein [Ammoniphilus sp. YIM 78166]|uniref:hypothetical protein n=1 Tax=Ammoniphilus sp. YIM 78166 TaxID=1644106 RepID=UPI00106F13F5|nr:hypothetical protein [Ammoniphilus sp. YIM 78166]